jgi:hypothetical protein
LSIPAGWYPQPDGHLPAGWYPQPDAQRSHLGGELWTEQLAPGVPQAPTAFPLLEKEHVAASSGRRFGVADSLGWGGLILVVLIGALSFGFRGATMMFGLFALVVGVIALARGRVGWARMGSRATGSAVLVAGHQRCSDRCDIR